MVTAKTYTPKSKLKERSRRTIHVGVVGYGCSPNTAKPVRSIKQVPRRFANTAKATGKLGFRPEVALEEGLRRLIEWRAHMARPLI